METTNMTTFNKCIECGEELRCLSDEILIGLNEDELDKYLKCDEDYVKLNSFEGTESHTDRVHLLTA